MHLPLHALTREADPFQRPLLGNVVHLRAGLYPVCGRRAEEILDELPLRFCPDPVTTVFGKQSRRKGCELRFLDRPKPQFAIHGASLADPLRYFGSMDAGSNVGGMGVEARP